MTDIPEDWTRSGGKMRRMDEKKWLVDNFIVSLFVRLPASVGSKGDLDQKVGWNNEMVR